MEITQTLNTIKTTDITQTEINEQVALKTKLSVKYMES